MGDISYTETDAGVRPPGQLLEHGILPPRLAQVQQVHACHLADPLGILALVH